MWGATCRAQPQSAAEQMANNTHTFPEEGNSFCGSLGIPECMCQLLLRRIIDLRPSAGLRAGLPKPAG